MVSLTGKLRRIFRVSGTPQHTVVAITGSGTAAMESALVSTVPPDRKILVIDNGAFGVRLVEVARVHDMDIVHLRYGWGEAVDPADVKQVLAAYPDIAVVAMVHHETSVGLLNPVGAVGALCRNFDALFVVDAVSSLGAEDIDVVRDNVDICYSSGNNCLHETPFTPAVSVYFALDAACGEFLSDGHVARFEMYRSRSEQLRAGLTALGMPSFTHTGMESHSTPSATGPTVLPMKVPEERRQPER